MSRLKRLKHAFNVITGGRPMKFESKSFRDVVSGLMVNRYVDGFGRTWLAESPWAWFRVKVSVNK